MISLSSFDAVATRLVGAHRVELGAYVLGAGAALRALASAAAGGAAVDVTLGGGSTVAPAVRAQNRRAAALLRQAGARVRFARAPFHLKAAVVDGVAFLDDRNWARCGASTVLRDDDPRDVAAAEAALRGAPPRGGAIAFRKDAAVAAEAKLLVDAGDAPVVVATETFSAGVVADLIARRAAHGSATTLIVDRDEIDAREARLLARLRGAGVTVRMSDAREKYLLAGDAAWVGSANATGGGASQVEWGLVTHDPAIVAALRRRAGISPAASPPAPGRRPDGADAADASAAGSDRTASAAPE